MSEFRTEHDWLSAFARQTTIDGVELMLDKLRQERVRRGRPGSESDTKALDGFRSAVGQMMRAGMTETEAVTRAVAALSDGMLFQVVNGQHR